MTVRSISRPSRRKGKSRAVKVSPVSDWPLGEVLTYIHRPHWLRRLFGGASVKVHRGTVTYAAPLATGVLVKWDDGTTSVEQRREYANLRVRPDING